MNITIFPLERMEIDGISIQFGMDRERVEALIGKGRTVRNRRYYYCNEMAIDYDNHDKVEFIEFLGGMDGSLKPVIYGVSAFDSDAEELLEILKQKNNGETDDTERGYSYGFLNLSVGVYREIRPEDVSEMIEEMKADGIPTENNADLEADKRRANHWAAIGFGAAGYYQR